MPGATLRVLIISPSVRKLPGESAQRHSEARCSNPMMKFMHGLKLGAIAGSVNTGLAGLVLRPSDFGFRVDLASASCMIAADTNLNHSAYAFHPSRIHCHH